MSAEPFSWAKFFSGFSTLVGWAKFASFWVKVALIVIPIAGGFFVYKSAYNKGYAKGSIVMEKLKDAEFKQWIADHPQQTISGSTVNNNVTPKDDRFKLSIFPLRVGWCN